MPTADELYDAALQCVTESEQRINNASYTLAESAELLAQSKRLSEEPKTAPPEV
jgi:hypothetical protein